MSLLYSFDPSLSCTGWAVFEDGGLVDCGYTKTVPGDGYRKRMMQATELPPRWDALPDVLAIEWPVVYARGKSKGDPNDLLSVAGVAGAIMCLWAPDTCCQVIRYRPREWKGTVKKEIMVKRVLNILDKGELDMYTNLKMPKTYAHNAVDAIGVGLKALGRIK